MKISIITVVYNNEDTIAECIESVLSQTYQNIEYIIIDGNSTDGTKEKIKPYLERIDYFSSEPDSGIFDAYNKGITRATGDIVGVLNSDDFFYSEKTIEKIVKAFEVSGSDLVYGKGVFVSKENPEVVKRIYPSNRFKNSHLLFGWIPLHPTIYVKRKIYEEYGLYNKNYSIAGDYDISLRWFKNEQIEKFFLKDWIVKMRLGGKSTTLALQKKKSSEDIKIIKYHKLAGYLTLIFKIGRKIPHHLIPRIVDSKNLYRWF